MRDSVVKVAHPLLLLDYGQTPTRENGFRRHCVRIGCLCAREKRRTYSVISQLRIGYLGFGQFTKMLQVFHLYLSL